MTKRKKLLIVITSVVVVLLLSFASVAVFKPDWLSGPVKAWVEGFGPDSKEDSAKTQLSEKAEADLKENAFFGKLQLGEDKKATDYLVGVRSGDQDASLAIYTDMYEQAEDDSKRLVIANDLYILSMQEGQYGHAVFAVEKIVSINPYIETYIDATKAYYKNNDMTNYDKYKKLVIAESDKEAGVSFDEFFSDLEAGKL